MIFKISNCNIYKMYELMVFRLARIYMKEIRDKIK